MISFRFGNIGHKADTPGGEKKENTKVYQNVGNKRQCNDYSSRVFMPFSGVAQGIEKTRRMGKTFASGVIPYD